jgi:hypothetical protein
MAYLLAPNVEREAKFPLSLFKDSSAHSAPPFFVDEEEALSSLSALNCQKNCLMPLRGIAIHTTY